jgi:hypothetical protein
MPADPSMDAVQKVEAPDVGLHVGSLKRSPNRPRLDAAVDQGTFESSYRGHLRAYIGVYAAGRPVARSTRLSVSISVLRFSPKFRQMDALLAPLLRRAAICGGFSVCLTSGIGPNFRWRIFPEASHVRKLGMELV